MEKSAPISYFFADPMTFSQEEWQAFGPRGSNALEKANQFSLTAVFRTWENYVTNAYAICRGVVLVQPQTDNADLVNLILRPFDQPFPGIKVKYFVYRGLRKGDFFDNNNKVLTSSENTSDFIHKINTSFASFYTSRGQAVPDFLAKYIGYDPVNQPGTMLLDDLFFKQATYTNNTEDPDMAFELPLIQGGASLGRFVDNNVFGVDVVLDYGDFREPSDDARFVFNLEYARLWRAELNIWDTIGTGALRLRRMEQVLQFIDVVAFYGAHAAGGIVKARISGQWHNKTANDIYTDLLSILYTKHRWYIYIQGDRTRSYNFYGNYVVSDTNSNDLKKGYTENAISETIYRTNEWPVLIDEDARLHSENINRLYLQFTKTPNNQNAMFYAQLGNVVNAQHNNFCDAINLSLPDDVDGTPAEWTRPLQLTVPAIEDSGNKYNIASFAILFYQGKDYDLFFGDSDITFFPSYIDDVFEGVDASPLYKTDKVLLSKSVSINKIRLINIRQENTPNLIVAVGIIILQDIISSLTEQMSRVSYLSETIDILNDQIDPINMGVMSNGTSSSIISKEGEYSISELLPIFETIDFTDNDIQVNGLILSRNNQIKTNFVLGISKQENEILLSAIENTNVNNVKIILLPYYKEEDIISDSDIYKKYTLSLSVETFLGRLSILSLSEEIIVYSLDEHVYFSKDYSKYVEQVSSIKGNINYEEDYSI
ncbi:hypothetical protein [Pedobacter montanisoli]|uniref:Uncharacterized protein n=1 Tax=Pedobacter montanisoli TaxID=2923277 RepID=A0ABS9ZXU3_9SPHI|nr:hypothetical protein [Pedobacter montanisoli]MCJ0743112.1 hypothetical protein [Pedobacter montanisoli]